MMDYSKQNFVRLFRLSLVKRFGELGLGGIKEEIFDIGMGMTEVSIKASSEELTGDFRI